MIFYRLSFFYSCTIEIGNADKSGLDNHLEGISPSVVIIGFSQLLLTLGKGGCHEVLCRNRLAFQ